jgi:hypothetical protein
MFPGYVSNAFQTQYPKIFSRTYWGGKALGDRAKTIFTRINQFVEKYGVTSLITPSNAWLKLHLKFDHLEIYNTPSYGCIVLFHPYHIPDEFRSRIEKKFGFKEIEPMYIPGAKTFMKVLPGKSALRLFNLFIREQLSLLTPDLIWLQKHKRDPAPIGKASFGTWLKKYKNDGTSIGDLARWLLYDCEETGLIPSDFRVPESLQKRLCQLHAYTDTINILRETAELYGTPLEKWACINGNMVRIS